MKKKIIVFGNTEYSYMIADYIQRLCEAEIAAFCVNEKYISNPAFYGIPVVPFESVEERFSPESVEFVLGLGYKSMNTIREKVYNIIKEKGYRIASFVHPTAVVETDDLGEGNIILSGAYIGYGTKIGNANVFWNGCNIAHNVQIGDYNYFAPSVTFGGFTVVGNNCFFGLGSTVKNRLYIADKTLVGAGAYLNTSTDTYDVYVPARTVKLEHKSTDMGI
ncbi:MAG: acetyltransferase [Ruminococcaceae bacterium]|nr:acetyltransferase [Oscillospiraceae bacterium]